MGNQREPPPGERRWRAILTAVLAVYGWRCLQTPGTYRWLDSLDLAIHETGHLVFAFGGETLTVLGGTLMQLLVPLAFAVALWRQGDRHGATVPLWWLGQNCWNISVYIKDARAQELPLVGGGEHDWAQLLGQAGWLERDQAIGGAVYFLGFVLYVAAVALGWWSLSRGIPERPGARRAPYRTRRRTPRPATPHAARPRNTDSSRSSRRGRRRCSAAVASLGERDRPHESPAGSRDHQAPVALRSARLVKRVVVTSSTNPCRRRLGKRIPAEQAQHQRIPPQQPLDHLGEPGLGIAR